MVNMNQLNEEIRAIQNTINAKELYLTQQELTKKEEQDIIDGIIQLRQELSEKLKLTGDI